MFRTHDMTATLRTLATLGLLCLTCRAAVLTAAEPVIVSGRLHHLRSGETREWEEFPRDAEGTRLELGFAATVNETEGTLELRQQDVRRNWKVSLNDRSLGELTIDENDLILQLPIPSGTLQAGDNRLVIECAAKPDEPADDVRVGEVSVWAQSINQRRREAGLEIAVTDADTGRLLPSRITITTADGALYPVAAEPADRTAVRAGCVYTADGRAILQLPAGRYVVYVGRGFEYSLVRQEFSISEDERRELNLTLRRVVPTDGYIACDTHVHSRTHSGHGDATVEERMITLAGEGIELPIATDHNVQIDHRPYAERLGLLDWFTPVIGNEVTTKRGHFNIFPIDPGAALPDHTVENWAEAFDEIEATPGVQVVILNHARDIHSGTRPFGPKLYNAVVAEQLAGWPLRMNAMEVINSGATQTETLQLLQDWMGLLNRGYRVTPIGSSDSHDVNRYIVGQGRTYIRGDDTNPGGIDAAAAARSLVQGRVLVSYGLIAELTVSGEYTSGDLVPPVDGELNVSVRVLGPDWVTPQRLMLYANGELIREAMIFSDRAESRVPGVQFEQTWSLERPDFDLFLTAIVVGDGIDAAFWRTAKPYQPTSPHWLPQTLGCSGAVFVDADGDGQWTAARSYAEQIIRDSDGALPDVFAGLSGRDSAVAAHVAHLLRLSRIDLDSADITALAAEADPPIRAGIDRYREAWRQNQVAQFE
ncbi:MAG: CehA/McbA family metallohydrolase [Planctomycetaceae bacterium]|nr:CehA/McbA family metallohydrolase [Planctomycetaceae bacterium]